jgi:hypothetical protein
MRTAQQRLSFLALQTHYPTTAIAWVGGIALSALYLLGGLTVTHLPLREWGALFGANILLGLMFFFSMRRFNLVEHERRSWALRGLALDLVTAPVYVAAAVAQLAGRPLSYVVTAKGSAATRDTWRTFRPHLLWLGVATGAISIGLVLNHHYPVHYVWAALTAMLCLVPLLHMYGRRTAATVQERLDRPRWQPVGQRLRHVLETRNALIKPQLGTLLESQATTGAETWLRLDDPARPGSTGTAHRGGVSRGVRHANVGRHRNRLDNSGRARADAVDRRRPRGAHRRRPGASG